MELEIISAKHINIEWNVPNTTERIKKMHNELKTRGQVDVDLDLTIDASRPLEAFIDTGRWGVQCECSGAEYVDDEDPVFWCFGCGNVGSGGKLRPVLFPADKEDIELLLEERPISVHKGLTKKTRVFNSQPLTSAFREWHPGDTVQKLKDKNKEEGLEHDIEKIKAKKKKVK